MTLAPVPGFFTRHTMQSLEKFLPRLLPQVPGCPHPLALQSLLDSAIEFCEETGAIQVTCELQPIEVGVPDYDTDTPVGTEIARLLSVTVRGRALHLAAHPPHPGDGGHPRIAYVNEDGGVSLFPTPGPDSDGNIAIRLCTRPTRDAKSLDNMLYSKWLEAITAGALYRLASTPGQPFTDMALAAASLGKFLYYLNRGRIEARRGSAAVDIRVHNQPFA